ncbi:MAG: polysaccharide deacetylase family protein [Thomasclavelia ramosa]
MLAVYDAKATFFVTGTNENYYDLIKKAHDQGHTIGLHTYIDDI